MTLQQLRLHGPSMHMPSGGDPLPWLGTYPYAGANAQQGAHMVGPLANRPAASSGTLSGSDGAVAGGVNFSAASGTFTAVYTGSKITITDPTDFTVSTYTVTYVTSTVLTLSGAYSGSSTSGLAWVLEGPPSNAGLSYFATDDTTTATGTLYHSTGQEWKPVSGPGVPFPPWQDYSSFSAPTVFLKVGLMSTQPTYTVNLAEIMIQSADGSLIDPYLSSILPWVTNGSVFWRFELTVATPGTVHDITADYYSVLTGAAPGRLLFQPSADFFDLYGSGVIRQVTSGTLFHVDIDGEGALLVPGLVDTLSDGAGTALRNHCRPTWPWTWADGDQISLFGLYNYGWD